MATAKAEGEKFSIHLIGDTTNLLWDGEFRAKKLLSFREKLQADRLRRELVGEAPGMVDPEAAASALIISQLSVRLTEVPEWWKEMKGGLEAKDFNLLNDVYKETMKVEEDYLAGLKKQGDAAKASLRAEEK